MRHAKKKRSLGLTEGARKALILNQCRSLFKHQRITTTYSKAKLVQPFAERILSLSRMNTLQNKRKVFQALNDHTLVKRVFEKLGPLFESRNGGFTRILRLKARRGDNAVLVIFELTKRLPEEKKIHVKDKKKKLEKPETVTPEVQKTPPAPKKEIKPKPVKPKRSEKTPKSVEKPQVKKKVEEKKQEEKKHPGLFDGISKLFKRKQEPKDTDKNP